MTDAPLNKSDDPKYNRSFKTGFINSFLLVFLSDFGDKSFLFLMFMSTKIPTIPLIITAYITSLTMNYLAIILGYFINKIINQNYVDFFGVVMLLIFGFSSIKEAVNDYLSEEENENEEIYDIEKNTVTNKYGEKNIFGDDENPLISLAQDKIINTTTLKELEQHNENLSIFKICFGIFVTIALSEIGDRSQLTVISFSSIYNIYGVIFGTSLGFIISNTIAIIFGQYVLKFISKIKLSLIGGLIMICFALQILINLI